MNLVVIFIGAVCFYIMMMGAAAYYLGEEYEFGHFDPIALFVCLVWPIWIWEYIFKDVNFRNIASKIFRFVSYPFVMAFEIGRENKTNKLQ